MMQASPGDNEIIQRLLPGVQGGGFHEKSPPGRRRQKCISWQPLMMRASPGDDENGKASGKSSLEPGVYLSYNTLGDVLFALGSNPQALGRLFHSRRECH
jgi:hypothetical protein